MYMYRIGFRCGFMHCENKCCIHQSSFKLTFWHHLGSWYSFFEVQVQVYLFSSQKYKSNSLHFFAISWAYKLDWINYSKNPFLKTCHRAALGETSKQTNKQTDRQTTGTTKCFFDTCKKENKFSQHQNHFVFKPLCVLFNSRLLVVLCISSEKSLSTTNLHRDHSHWREKSVCIAVIKCGFWILKQWPFHIKNITNSLMRLMLLFCYSSTNVNVHKVW